MLFRTALNTLSLKGQEEISKAVQQFFLNTTECHFKDGTNEAAVQQYTKTGCSYAWLEVHDLLMTSGSTPAYKDLFSYIVHPYLFG